MTSATPERLLERAVELLAGAECSREFPPSYREKWAADLDALRAEMPKPPDPVKEAIALMDKTYEGTGWLNCEKAAWQTLRARLTAPPLDEKAIRGDEARLCAKWGDKRYGELRSAGIHGGVEDACDIINRAGKLDGIAEFSRALSRFEHRASPQRSEG